MPFVSLKVVGDGHHTGSETLVGKYSATLASDSANSATSSSRYNVRGGAKEADVAKADALRPISAELGTRFPPLALVYLAWLRVRGHIIGHARNNM